MEATPPQQSALLADQITEVENKFPNSTLFVMGDFNHTDLRAELPKYHQLVHCATRGERTLDHCYSTIKDAYRACAPLGNSDHAVVKLIPTYRSLININPSRGLYRDEHPRQLNHCRPVLTLLTGQLSSWHAITLMSMQTHVHPMSTFVRISASPDIPLSLLETTNHGSIRR